MMKIGLLGAGPLGQIHLKALLQNPEIEIAGLYDPDAQKARDIGQKYQVQVFAATQELIRQSEIVDIVSPQLSHPYLASEAIKNSKHVYLEQPVGSKPEELVSLMELAGEAHVQVQVGFSDRFNPAFQTALKYIKQPMYVELRRSLSFDHASDKSPVVNDIMPGDIDLVTSLIKANIKSVEATAVNVFGNNPNLVNTRLAFDNGAVANITTSRIATGTTHEIRVYQEGSRLQIDLLNQKIYLLGSLGNEEENIPETMPVTDQNLTKINAALTHLIHAVHHQLDVSVSISDAYHALKITAMINDKLSLVNSKI